MSPIVASLTGSKATYCWTDKGHTAFGRWNPGVAFKSGANDACPGSTSGTLRSSWTPAVASGLGPTTNCDYAGSDAENPSYGA